jgi:ketosteroid isomerase-like protein
MTERNGVAKLEPAGNVGVIRQMLDCFNRATVGALDHIDTQVEIEDEPRMPGAGWNYGHRGAVEWSSRLRQCFEELSLEISDELESGDCVVARWQAAGRGRRSGAPVEMGGYCVFTLRARRIRRVEFHESLEAALLAGGLSTSSQSLSAA